MTDFTQIARQIFAAANEALVQGAVIVEIAAKAKAPVRSIFEEDEIGRSIRMKSRFERRAEAPAAKALGYKPSPMVRTDRPLRRWHQRRLANLEANLAEADRLGFLTLGRRGRRVRPLVFGHEGQNLAISRRGVYEINSKRAAFSTFQHTHIGGRLRGEISTGPLSVSGYRSEVWVISPTPYAKYMEFGTRHVAARPFLRPAAEESREEVISRIAAAIKEAASTQSVSMELEVVVRL